MHIVKKLVFFILIISINHHERAAGAQFETKNGHSNIVVIVCDSMDGRLVTGGRYEGVVKLPNIRALSKSGVTYLNAYSNNPICAPSRSALWSGLHTHITDSWNNYKALPDDFNMTWADVLSRQAGYDVKILGKTDFKSGAHTVSNRVEAWTRNVKFALRQEARPTVELTGNKSTIKVNVKDWKNVENAVEFLQNKSLEGSHNTFLLYVGLNMPHPYSTESSGENPGASTFKTSPYWLDKVSTGDIHIPQWLPLNQMHPVDIYSTIVKNCSSQFSQQELIDIKSYFYAMCAETDAMVGEIFDAINKYGFTESTYVVFTSDHGELAMEHRQFYKMSMYEGSSHVPLVIAFPKNTERKNTKNEYKVQFINTPVSLVDIYPTFMDIANLHKPIYLNGSSLLPEMIHEHPDWILSQYHGCNVNASSYMLRKGPWKYIAYDYGPEYIDSMLFNLEDDPDELNDLGKTDHELLKQFDEFLRKQIDYNAVTNRVKLYNKRSFSNWRKSLGSKYADTISNLRWWMDWKKDPEQNQAAIDKWLFEL
uniref:arylsulfatase K-like n=1 Tax=Styela clava TaxID=7725 RepID=UPI001939C07B|nr:arylsulfatase K-like [Styela clava]